MRLIRGLIAAGALLAFTACSSAPPRPAPRAPAPRTPAPPGSVSGEAEAATAHRVVHLARSLIDVPYRHAGSDRRGFDCSGLTSYVFARVGVALPRTAAAQSKTGRWVAPDELAPGDLVFFGATRDKPHHVGLVVSSPGRSLRMIHASSSRGVIETEVTASAYWLERLSFGRRVLSE